MRESDVPTKFPKAFAQNAGGYTRIVPPTSADPNAASFALGFPPNTFTPVGAGGSAPDGRDVNGVLQMISQWAQWQQAGAGVFYDATFASQIGGYPQGAVLKAMSGVGNYWISLTEANESNPDSGGANWQPFTMRVENALTSPAGWAKLWGGLILQWGRSTTVTGNGDPVEFPIAFPNACFGVLASEGNAGGGWGITVAATIYGTMFITTTGFKIYAAAQALSGDARFTFGPNITYQYLAWGF